MKIAVDLGGTNMRVGLAEGAKIIDKKIIPCPSDGSEREVLDTLFGLISELAPLEIEGIGVGVPTVVDTEKGIVYNAFNIPSWKEVRLKEELETRFHVRAEVNNDANCFALGEKVFGAGRDVRDMVGLTLGTGVGVGLILNGRLYNGHNTGAGEVCAIPYRGLNYEEWCSSAFFTREYGISGKEAAVRGFEEDPKALAIWDAFGYHMGQLMKLIMLAYDPEKIVIGGGISSAYPLFKQSMRAAMEDFPYPESLRRLSICVSELPDVALLGAAALVNSNLQNADNTTNNFL